MGQKRERPTEEELNKDNSDERGDNFVPTDDELAAEENAANAGDNDDAGQEAAAGDYLDTKGNEDNGDNEGDEPRIPKSRLDEVIAQREQEKGENAQLRNQVAELIQLAKGQQKEDKQEPTVSFDFDAKRKEAMNAMLEGDEARYVQIDNEIEAARRDEWAREINNVKQNAINEARAEAGRLDDDSRFNNLVTKNEAEHPFLDGSSERFSQNAVDEVNELFEVFTKGGMTKSDAVQRAVDLVVPKYKEPDRIGKNSSRKEEALSRNASAQNRQPNAMRGKGARDKDYDELDASKMTDSQFDKLTNRDISNMRGDFL